MNIATNVVYLFLNFRSDSEYTANIARFISVETLLKKANCFVYFTLFIAGLTFLSDHRHFRQKS